VEPEAAVAPGERGLETLRALAEAHRRHKIIAVNEAGVEDFNFRAGRRVLPFDGKERR
jgi:hypothetical protein